MPFDACTEKGVVRDVVEESLELSTSRCQKIRPVF